MKLNNLLQIKEKYRKLILIIESFFATWAIMKIANLHPMNVIAFFFFLLSYVFFSALDKETLMQDLKTIKIQYALSMIIAIAFTIFYLSDTWKEMISDLNNKLFQVAILSAVAIGLYLLLYKGIRYLMCKFKTFTLMESEKSDKIIPYLPLLSFVTIILCRLPWLLYSYPGILTPDSINQFEQVLGMIPFSNHHPWVHTMTISLLYHIGCLFTSSQNGAFVFFTIYQICFMAFAVSYLVWVVSKYTKNLPFLIGLVGIYAFLPYHSVMAICIWKDVLFSGSMLLFCTSLYYLLREGIAKQQLISLILYFLSGFFMCLYRSNGWYAFILSLPFLLFAFRKKWLIMLPLHLALMSLVLIIKGPLMEHYEVTQPDFVESISIPLQQIGRVIATGQELTVEQEELLNKILKTEYVAELYTEYISDNMKELVRANDPTYLEEHKFDFLKLWFELDAKYPEIFLDAYVAQTRGYYSPSVSYSVAEVDGIIDNETGLFREYLIGGKLIVKLREILMKLQEMIPLYGSLWSMGSLFWGTILFLGFSLSKHNSFSLKSELNYLDITTVWLPNLAVIATLLIATPVAIEFRYAYNLAYCLPLYYSIMMITTEKN